MSESEGRMVKWSGDSKSADDPKAAAKRKEAIESLALHIYTPRGSSGKPKKRIHSSKTESRYARIRQIPREVPLKTYCQRVDAMQAPLRIPDAWQKAGCPTTYVEAFKSDKWRKRIHDERQNAWRGKK